MFVKKNLSLIIRIRLAYACLIQHDDRRSAGQVGRSFSRRTDTGKFLMMIKSSNLNDVHSLIFNGLQLCLTVRV